MVTLPNPQASPTYWLTAEHFEAAERVVSSVRQLSMDAVDSRARWLYRMILDDFEALHRPVLLGWPHLDGDREELYVAARNGMTNLPQFMPAYELVREAAEPTPSYPINDESVAPLVAALDVVWFKELEARDAGGEQDLPWWMDTFKAVWAHLPGWESVT